MAPCLHGDGAKLILRGSSQIVGDGQEVDADLFLGIPGQPRWSVKLIAENGWFRTDLKLSAVDRQMAAGKISLSGYQRLADAEEDTRDASLQALSQAFIGASPYGPPTVDPLPAIYTYFGQFIAHEVSRLFQAEEGVFSSLNTSRFDLDTVFYPTGKFSDIAQGCAPLCEVFGDAALGNTAPGTTINLADLPRTVDGAPVVPDCRNDANPMLAQLHVAILEKYRALIPKYGRREAYARLKTLLHAIAINDYLREVVDACVYNDVSETGRKLVNPQQTPPQFFLTPIEFAAGAFRFGHAMVRDSYRWSKTHLDREAELPELLLHTHVGGGLFKDGIPAIRRLPTDWTMEKADMFEAKGKPMPNLANRIHPAIASGLQDLAQTFVPGAEQLYTNLAEKTLLRGQEVMLPSAQRLWTRIEPKCGRFLTENEITGPPGSRFYGALTTRELCHQTLAERTPLWFYVLRESEVLHDGRKLGPLGGRIVLETIHAAISAAGSDPSSLPPATLSDLFNTTTT